MFGFIKNIFKSSETVVFEETLEDFDVFMTNNVLALKAAERLVSRLEEAGYKKEKIKKVVKDNMPKIIELAKKSSEIMNLAVESSSIVVSRNELSDELSDKVKKNVKKHGSEDLSEKDVQKEILNILQEIKTVPEENQKAKQKATA